MQSAHLSFRLPWGHGLHSAHWLFCLPCEHRFVPVITNLRTRSRLRYARKTVRRESRCFEVTFARPRTTTFHAMRSGESTFDRAAVGGKYCRHQGASRCRGVFLRTPSVPASRRLTHARRTSSRLCVTRSSRRVSVNRLPSRRLVSSNVIAQLIRHSG